MKYYFIISQEMWRNSKEEGGGSSNSSNCHVYNVSFHLYNFAIITHWILVNVEWFLGKNSRCITYRVIVCVFLKIILFSRLRYFRIHPIFPYKFHKSSGNDEKFIYLQINSCVFLYRQRQNMRFLVIVNWTHTVSNCKLTYYVNS